MKQNGFTFFFLTLLALLGFLTPVTASVPDSVKTWTSENTVFVSTVDVATLKLKPAYNQLLQVLQPVWTQTFTGENELTQELLPIIEDYLDSFDSQLDRLNLIGADTVYILISSNQSAPLIVTIPFSADKKKQAAEFLEYVDKMEFLEDAPEDVRHNIDRSFYRGIVGNALVFAPNLEPKDELHQPQSQYLESLQNNFNGKLNPRLDELISNSQAEIFCCLVPNEELTQIFEKMDEGLQNSPSDAPIAKMGEIPQKLCANGFQAFTAEFYSEPFDIKIRLISKDEQSSENLFDIIAKFQQAIVDGIKSEADMEREAMLLTEDCTDWLFKFFTPEQKKNQLVWSGQTILNRIAEIIPEIEQSSEAGLQTKYTPEQIAEGKRLTLLAEPFITSKTVSISHLDVRDFQFRKTGIRVLDELKRILPNTFSQPSNITVGVTTCLSVLGEMDLIVNRLKQVGGGDIFAVVQIDENYPLVFVVPFDLAKKDDAKSLLRIFRQISFIPQSMAEEIESQFFRGVYKNNLLFGVFSNSLSDTSQHGKAFVKSLKERQTEEYTLDVLEAAFTETARSPFQTIVVYDPIWKFFIDQIDNAFENFVQQYPMAEKLLPWPTEDNLQKMFSVTAVEVNPFEFYANFHIISQDNKGADLLQQTLKGSKKIVTAVITEALKERVDSDEEMKLYYRTLQCNFNDMVNLNYYLYMPERNGNIFSFRSNVIYKRHIDKFPLMKSEKMVVIGTCGIVVGLILPAFQSVRDAARMMENKNKMRQIGISMLSFEDVYRRLPKAYTVDEDGKPLHSWRVALLPFLEEQDMYDSIRLDEPWDSEYNKQFHDKCPEVFKNPNVELKPSETTYAVITGEGTAFVKDKKMSLAAIGDGTSNTIMLVERTPVCWMDPNSDVPYKEAVKGVNVSKKGIQSYYNDEFAVVFFDSTTLSIKNNIDEEILKALITPNGGESSDDF